MATNKPMTESQLSERYTQASRKFITTTGWRDLLSLAEEFHALDTYKDSPQMYIKCIKGASASAYREITTSLEQNPDADIETFREAARIMGIIQDYADARELMRVYTVKANALTYRRAVDLISNAEATTEEWGEAIDLLRTIKGYRDSRDMLERYERYYFDRVYREALDLMENGHVYTEFEEAADLFEKISTYSDAAAQAAACRKKANQLRPKVKKAKPTKAKPSATQGSDSEIVKPVKPSRQKREKPQRDETVNGFVEVWRALDKRRLFVCILWWLGLIANIVISILVGSIKHEWIIRNADTIRFFTIIGATVTGVMGAREFLRMLTTSMRQKLVKAILAVGRKVASPFVKVLNKLLISIGIDISRRGRLSGHDERSFVYEETQTTKKKKKKLKNELRWGDQPNNAARVRFIFIDYMIHRIRKGYHMRHSMTTLEIRDEIAIEPEEQNLFEVYQKARYAGIAANEEISDTMIIELKKINERRN